MSYINVCIACDDNYAKHAGVLIASVLKNANKDDKLSFYILDTGISEEKKNKIKELKSIKDCLINFVEIDENDFSDYKAVKSHNYITFASYCRLKLSKLLPSINKIIYFDCDIVVNSSLKELFNTNLENNPIAGVSDINKNKVKKNKSYVNAGVLLLDLNKIREINLEDDFLNYTKENINKITCGDQEIINEVCKNKITLLDEKWNVQSSNFTNRSSYMKNPNIVHFVASKKPWHWASFSYHKKLYFKYLQLTPWKMDKKEYSHWTKDNQIASLIEYIKYRPLFLLRPKFYIAIYKTYLRG